MGSCLSYFFRSKLLVLTALSFFYDVATLIVRLDTVNATFLNRNAFLPASTSIINSIQYARVEETLSNLRARRQEMSWHLVSALQTQCTAGHVPHLASKR